MTREKENSILIVVPAYNVKQYVGRTIDSIRRQTYKNVNIVCVDDCSRDGTSEILDKMVQQGYIVLDKHFVNQGLTATFNRCLAHLDKESFMCIAHADDIMLEDNIAEKISVLENNSSVGLVCSNARIINERDEQGDLLIREEKGNALYNAGDEAFAALFFGGNWVVAPSVVMRAEAIKQAGSFNSKLGLATDYNMWLRIAARWGIAYLEKPLIKYRIHGGQDSKRYNRQAALREDYLARRLALEASREYLHGLSAYDDYLRTTYSSRAFEVCEALCLEGRRGEAWRAWIMGMRVGRLGGHLPRALRLLGMVLFSKRTNRANQ